MRRISTILCLATWVLVATGCTIGKPAATPTPGAGAAEQPTPTLSCPTPIPCPDCPSPEPCPTATPQPDLFADGSAWIGTGPQRQQPLGVTQSCQLFEVEMWEPYVEPLYEFTSAAPGIAVLEPFEFLTGTVRMALARPVSNVLSPTLPGDAASIDWVVLIPETEVQCAATWQEGITGEPTGEGTGSLVVERPVSKVIPFANDTSSLKASLRIARSNSSRAPRGRHERRAVDRATSGRADGRTGRQALAAVQL